MASDSANTAPMSNSQSATEPPQNSASASTSLSDEQIATSSSSQQPSSSTASTLSTALADTTIHDSSSSYQAASNAAVTTTPSNDQQPTSSSSQSVDPSSSSAHPPSLPAPTSTNTSSMLPRASSTSSGSTSSSGTATPVPRLSSHRSPASLAAASRATSNLNTSAPGLRPSLASAARRPRPTTRTTPSEPRYPTAASAMANTFTSGPVPSIFGYYSHDANPTGPPPSANTSSTTNQPQSAWGAEQAFLPPATHPPTPSSSIPFTTNRAPSAWAQQFFPPPAQHQRRPSNPSDPTRTNHLAPDPRISSPRVPNLTFYAQPAQRLQPSAWSTRHRSNASHPTNSAQNHVDSSLLSASVPAEQPTFEETTTISFTWTVRDLHLLREEVELSPPPSEGGRSVSAGAGKSDVWTSQPVFGDNKWKLELVRTTRPLTSQLLPASSAEYNGTDDDDESTTSAVQGESSSDSTQRTTITILSVYLTALVLDYTHANVEIPASIMVGLRPVRAAVGRRGAESGGYLWRRFYDFTFQKEADLFTCHDLPSVSDMLQDLDVARDDAIALTIQLGLGPGHTRSRSGQLDDAAIVRAPVEVDGHHIVPRAVLNSLHGLLDDANTGDVRILVRERGILLPDESDSASMSDDGHHDDALADPLDRVVPFPIGSHFPIASAQESEAGTITSIEDDPDRIFVRDRVLWAHASVLKSRSDYFQTMLASDFSEGISRNYGPNEAVSSGHTRNVRTLQISDADFVTAYWFLRYLYTDDIQFADKEDARSAVLDEEWAKGADLGYLTAGSAGGDPSHAGGLRKNTLVNWTPISQLKDYDDDFDMDGLDYAMPANATAGGRRDVSGSFVLQAPSVHASSSTSGSLRQRTSAGGAVDGSSSSIVAGSSSNGGARPVSAPSSPSVPAGSKHYTADDASRKGGRDHRTISNASTTRTSGPLDPHEHPCADPGPASALSIYKLAHRYHMQDLSRLASMHMVATLTPQSAFPMLLATSMYTELHTRIKTYVYQHWHLVSHTQEFERCCDEVSVGMWGADAGKTMRAFVRSLVSPLRAAQS